MKDLIAKLEAATGPDRELDMLIARSLGMEAHHVCDTEVEPNLITRGIGYLQREPGDNHWQAVPRYTASIDASLPGENIVQIKRLTVGHPDGDKWEAVQYPGGQHLTARANTEALARRIASLKARSHVC